MKNIKLAFFSTLLVILWGCHSATDPNQIILDIQRNIDSGNLSAAIHLADSIKNSFAVNEKIFQKADSLAQIAERIRIDFSVSEDQVIRQIEKKMGSFLKEDWTIWEKKGWLEWRLINGEKNYFKRAASNLLLIKKFHEQKEERLREIAEDPNLVFRLKHTEDVYNASDNQSNPVVPVNMRITYTITVHPDVVPEGEKIRCWLPWPKEYHRRQQKVELLSTSAKEYKIAPDSSIHSSIYMEELSKKGAPTVFQISFRYQSNAQYFAMSGIKILPYDKRSYNYLKYTSEQLPHICFSDDIRRLADSITSKDDNPTTIVRKIYYWFKDNIPWAGALEYSIIPDIPEYVYKNRRGDCGMKVFLFMSMLRYKGVQVRWQSGFQVPPDDVNLHDWCEVYYEGTGWVPVDVDYNLQQSEKEPVKEFYLSGIDSYRLIVNDGVAGPLHPEKHYMRSEPYDFQRGEVEWKGGNLYFDKWDYNMIIEYIK
jgi:hypothetical protein